MKVGFKKCIKHTLSWKFVIRSNGRRSIFCCFQQNIQKNTFSSFFQVLFIYIFHFWIWRPSKLKFNSFHLCSLINKFLSVKCMPVEKFKVPNNFVNSPIFFDFSIEYTTPFRTLAHQYIYVYICYIYICLCM